MTSFRLPLSEVEKSYSAEHAVMNDIDCAMVYAVADPSVQELLPPPLKLADPPLIMIYVSDIKQPLFGEPYRECGIGATVTLADGAREPRPGVYYFGLLLAGSGAQNATFKGREESGLPKKFADNIVLRRNGDNVEFWAERHGVRLVAAHLKIGEYNFPSAKIGLENLDPATGKDHEGTVFNHRYRVNSGSGYSDLEILAYGSKTHYRRFEPAFAEVELESSPYDPWGEIKLAGIIGGAWFQDDNWVTGVSPVYKYPPTEVENAMCYLLAGRSDPYPDLPD